MRKYERGDTMEMKEIKEYPNYFITDDGRVWSKNRNKFLSLNPNTQGYLKVSLWKDGKPTTKPVHRLVAETFIPNPNNFSQVNHKDENKLNNNVDNLEWVSPRENNLHYYQEIKKKVKEKKQFEKSIPVIQYDLQHNKIAEYNSMSQAHKATGVSVTQIARCIHKEVSSANGFIWEEGSTTK